MEHADKRYAGPGRPCPYCGRMPCICGEETDKVEVAIGQGKTATFYREAGEVLLENEESAFFLDREEAYRLLSLLEAEFKIKNTGEYHDS